MITTHQTLLFLTTSSLFILSLHNFFQTCDANSYCSPSVCGIIRNISSPFRLKDDPKNCGYRTYELACENNVTVVYLNSQKYYVKEINYRRSTIRLVDASINNDICSFPIYSLYAYNFSRADASLLVYYTNPFYDLPLPINLMRCPNPLKNSSLFTDITDCASNLGYTYIKVGRMTASEVPYTCRVDLIVMTSWDFKNLNNVSLSEIHHSLLYGFDLRVCTPSFCLRRALTKWEIFKIYVRKSNNVFHFIPLAILVFIIAGVSLPVTIIIALTGILVLWYAAWRSYTLWGAQSWSSNAFGVYVGPNLIVTGLISSIIIFAPKFIICPLVVWLLIYKFRTRRFSIFDAIESFLQSDNKLVPIRYSYSDIKKMTKGFQEKLGEGGYGSVYKGKLRSGHDVAVKLLRKSGGNGQDFMNEIATIGRIHHVNVVKLVGYCAHGTKRALVFDFMPNGSLEKYLFNQEKMNSLNWDTKFDIAVGIARGIEYLHQGCNIQILHFDIKPHNILLDDNFIPKISDFGLAKFCSVDKNTMTMTAARGTIGYVAPELISRSIGAVSYKADVYSFGMLLVEMVGLNKELRENNDDSSKYFPYWIYDHFNHGKEIEIEKAEENNGNGENETKKSLTRKMTIVALWCIQMNPDDRPSMNKVLEMLEADVERLQNPEYPSESAHMAGNEEESWGTSAADSI